MKKKYIALDLDGTLAQYDGFKGPSNIGEPIKKTVILLRKWISDGHEVEIFTSRVSPNEFGFVNDKNSYLYIKKWLKNNGLPDLEITCIKKKKFTHFYDDRAVRIKKNTGEIDNEYSEE